MKNIKVKSIISFFLICLITMAGINPVYAETVTDNDTNIKQTYKGDVSLDGYLSIVDATMIQQYLACLYECPYIGLQLDIECPYSGIIGDVNDDTNINIMDATIIQYYLAELPIPETEYLSVGDPFNYSTKELEKELYYKNYFNSDDLEFDDGCLMYYNNNTDSVNGIEMATTDKGEKQIMIIQEDLLYTFHKTNSNKMFITHSDETGKISNYSCEISDEDFNKFQSAIYHKITDNLFKHLSIKNLNYTDFDIIPPYEDKTDPCIADVIEFNYKNFPYTQKILINSDTHKICYNINLRYEDEDNSISFDYSPNKGGIFAVDLSENPELCDANDIIEDALTLVNKF